MKKKIHLVPSGIPLADKKWNGFYRGGTYFLIGRHKSGKTLLGIQYAKECVKAREVCLFFTTLRPKDLMIHAASIDFDLQHYMDQNLIIVVRVTPPQPSENPDEILTEYLSDIASLVQQYHPNRMVFDELTPFVEFKDSDLLKNSFLQTTETIEELNVISLFILGEPATVQSQKIVDMLYSLSTGSIHLEKQEGETKYQSGVITITPNIGHIEGEFSYRYIMKPYVGISIEQENDNEEVEKPRDKKEEDYIKLSDFEIPDEDFGSYNFYTLDEFSLFINNQIAVYKSTGQKFSLFSFRIDEEASKLGILNLNQFKNVIRLSIEKKDKVCVINDKIIVLAVRSSLEKTDLISKIKNNLPLSDLKNSDLVLQYISLFIATVDETINSADDILKKLLVDVKV